ncbi:DUF2357 domain-containing protein [Caballeronia sp. SBC2]|uniref:DUF2357 domain-containing protein n=1 Tax=Caballeronia sp. SBC2 TaxID=2705547 RepID=UPI0013E0FDAD|nr:DUF2357 domain-containing protein [Caballeronia sp. SBC2]QIE30191.1 hypothetical protein SBC2_82670 [Caballeronia sp. SBC2]
MKISLQKVYADFRDKNGDHEIAQALLGQWDWFYGVAEFDPKTGEALPQSLSPVLAKVAEYSTPNRGAPFRDRLWRIVEHSRASVERLFRSLNENPRREQALLPVGAVRELDANSFIKLSNRPGRNIREKLAGKPYLQAVRRFQSVDLTENRLLKAFATRLAELLELRRDCIGEEDDDLLPRIQSWLHSDVVRAIARWDNLPPNNTLLSHRDYRRVWDAWRWLQTLDDDIAGDLSKFEARDKAMHVWKKSAQMWADGQHLFAEIPVLFDFEKIEIRACLPQLTSLKSKQKISRRLKREEIPGPACLDLTDLHPSYAISAFSRSLRETYLWQRWEIDGESVDVELFNADAAYLHADATSISSLDLFFSKDNTYEYLDRAAQTFASRLREVFKNDTLIWLVPDSLNDFELEVTRRHLNARFADARPLPRSVAAALGRVDYSRISRDGFAIAVVDGIGGKTCVTKLLARFDPKLKERLPETGGYYWERYPPVIISSADLGRAEGKGYDFITVDGQGRWRDATRPEKPQYVDSSLLKLDPRVGQFAFRIDLNDSPVVGGMRLNSLQQRAGDIPLWRDQIPELSIKVMKDGRYQRFHLVSRGTTVKAMRGTSIPIPVDEEFTLPAGKPFYQFPLFQGENAEKLGFSARLESPAFPLKENAVCKLDLTFDYGADEPYKLVFTALDNSVPPVRATWRKTEEVVIIDAPSPKFPTPMSWAELCCVPKLDSSETSDLLDWVLNAIKQLDRDLFRTTGEITSNWHEDKNGEHFTFVRCDATDSSVFVHESDFVKGFSCEDFEEGDSVSFELQERAGKYSGRKVGGADYKEPSQSVVENIRKRLRFPIIQVWRDGRSINNTDCPWEFANNMRQSIEYLAGLLQNDRIPNPIQHEVLYLLACMHKDSPAECVQWITEQVKNDNIRVPQVVGFALGDVSEQWQKDVFAELVTRLTSDSLRVFAYAIWREPHFVERFSFAELESILRSLTAMLGEIRQCPPRRDEKDKKTARNWARGTAEPIELLLGLLRTRASSDSEIKMLLQPHQKLTKQLANQVERVAEIVMQSAVMLSSRMQINIPKLEGDHRTPDLLYALRLYLSGDDGANAIHITSVSDGDNE